MSVKAAIVRLERLVLSDFKARANIFWIFLHFTSSDDYEQSHSAQPWAQHLCESAKAATTISKCIEMDRDGDVRKL
jgi:hypothetical protein